MFLLYYVICNQSQAYEYAQRRSGESRAFFVVDAETAYMVLSKRVEELRAGPGCVLKDGKRWS